MCGGPRHCSVCHGVNGHGRLISDGRSMGEGMRAITKTRACFATFAVLLSLAAPAAAQDWPTRPVTLVVPFAAGGPVDTAARIMAARLTENLGQQVIVENVSGAGSMMGGNRVAKAAPD